MKNAELIEQLKELNPNAEIFIWIDGNRYPITYADELSDCIDINAQVNE